jgi:hypothetical protein
VSALSRFEGLVERLFEGSLVGLLGGEVQPVEMARRLARAMENERTIGVGRAIAPNDYTVYLSPEDYGRFQPVQRRLEEELEDYLREAARERQWAFLGRPAVHLEALDSIGRHQIKVTARLLDRPTAGGPAGEAVEHTQRFTPVQPGPVQPRPTALPPAATGSQLVLVGRADGSRYALTKPVIAFGRALDNDVVLEDTRVSRYHAELRLHGERYQLRDLRSTNGTFLNGRSVVEEPIRPGDVVSFGGLELLVQARREPEAPAAPGGQGVGRGS